MAIFSVLIPKELGSTNLFLSEVPEFLPKTKNLVVLGIKHPTFSSVENSCVPRIQKGAFFPTHLTGNLSFVE